MEAKKAIIEAQQIYDAVGDKWDVAKSMMSLGVVLSFTGEYDATERLYLQFGELSKGLGVKSGVEGHRACAGLERDAKARG